MNSNALRVASSWTPPFRASRQVKTVSTEHRHTGERLVLWKRPIAEVEARGLPTTIHILAFEFGTDTELQKFQELICRIKYSDAPTALWARCRD